MRPLLQILILLTFSATAEAYDFDTLGVLRGVKSVSVQTNVKLFQRGGPEPRHLYFFDAYIVERASGRIHQGNLGSQGFHDYDYFDKLDLCEIEFFTRYEQDFAPGSRYSKVVPFSMVYGSKELLTQLYVQNEDSGEKDRIQITCRSRTNGIPIDLKEMQKLVQSIVAIETN